VAEQGDQGGGEDAADDGRIEDDPGGQPRREDLDVGLGYAAQGDERQAEDQRAGRDQPTGVGDTRDDGVVGGAAVLVLLVDPRQDEHLVVHRESEQQCEHRERHPEGDRAGRG
jgi:hypothetical protein